jgi:hypothetical protein
MEPILYINAPIDAENVAHFQKTMQAHGARLQKIRPNDDSDRWWTILLPEGTVQQVKEMQVEVPRYKIFFPDGYWFLFEVGTKNRQGIFTRVPVIYIDQPAEEGGL